MRLNRKAPRAGGALPQQLVLDLDGWMITRAPISPQPWPVRVVGRRYRLPPQIAAVVAGLAGIGGAR
jgi:hypothetical protein